MKLPKVTKLIIMIGSLIIVEVALVTYIGWWRNPFWAAIEHRDLYQFFVLTGYFALAALTACLVSGYGQYLVNYTAMVFRTRLTRRAIKLDYEAIEGGAQRVQEDCFQYPLLLLNLICLYFKNLLMILSMSVFVVVQLGWIYLLIPIIYTIIGTYLAGKVAKPLINLNYINQNFEAAFRACLTKLNYKLVYRNNYNLYRATKFLTYFQSFYNQVSVLVPYLILSVLYFSAKITFGIFMQMASVMSAIIDSLSCVANSFNDLNKFLSCRRRLKELGVLK